MFEEVFVRKKILLEKLESFGFQKQDSIYIYEREIRGGEFALTVTIDEQGNVDTSLLDQGTEEEYVLYKTAAQGTLVGEIRQAIQEVLEDIAENCYEDSVFRQEQTNDMIRFVAETYGDGVEFLWEKFPNYGVWRRQDSQKWYGIIMTVEKTKLGIDSKEKVEILDLRAELNDIPTLLEKEDFYPGWHMNKKYWYAIILDGSISDEELKDRIETSYKLAK